LSDIAEEEAKAFAAGATPDEAARDAWVEAALEADNRPRIEISGQFTLAGNPVPEATDGSPATLAFGLDKVDAVLPKPLTTGEGLAVMQLKDKTAVDQAEFDTEKAKIVSQLRLMKQAEALSSYVARLRKVVEDQITINQDMVNPPKSEDS
jgi:hypothetical protein